MAESVYRHLPNWRIKWAYRRAMRKYAWHRDHYFTFLAQGYLDEAGRLADEIDRRANNG